MTDLTVRRMEMLVRVVNFLISSPVMFRKDSRGPQLVEQFKQSVARVRELTAKQVSDFAITHANSGARSTARDGLAEAMGKICRCAQGMAKTMPGVDGQFRIPRSTSDSVLLASAHSFAETAGPLKADFITFEMDPTFLDDLSAKIDAFEQAFSDHAKSRTTHVATSKEIDEAMKEALDILAQLDPIVENKLDGNFNQMQQWKNVRHTERAWVSKKTTKPKPAADPPAAA